MTKSKYPRGYFTNDENIKSELLKLYNEVGKENFTMKYIRNKNRAILNGVEKHSSKNLKQLCDELNLDHNIHGNKYKRGYWEKESNIKKEIVEWYNKVGIENFNYANLKTNRSELFNGINRSNKNLLEWADELGLKYNNTPKDYYKNIDNVYKETMLLINKYGFFPNYEILSLEGKHQIPIALRLWHSTTQSEYIKSLGYEIKGQSKLERYVKSILDIYIDDTNYVDNRFKSLEDYGVSLYNEISNQYLELDRYYYSQRLAIEIQGQQHYVSKAWNQSTKRLHDNDKLKRRLLKEQGIKLIEIKYNEIKPQDIYNQLKKGGVYKLRENWKLSDTETINCEA